jgi:hypothetical protein
VISFYAWLWILRWCLYESIGEDARCSIQVSESDYRCLQSSYKFCSCGLSSAFAALAKMFMMFAEFHHPVVLHNPVPTLYQIWRVDRATSARFVGSDMSL